jgi:hypothetical protein
MVYKVAKGWFTPFFILDMPSLRLGSIAPDFEAETTTGPIKFHDWIGDSWVSAGMLMDLVLALQPISLFYLGRSLLSSWRLYPCLHNRARGGRSSRG